MPMPRENYVHEKLRLWLEQINKGLGSGECIRCLHILQMAKQKQKHLDEVNTISK